MATRQRHWIAQRFKDAPAMLALFHRTGGLAAASRSELCRSGATGRLKRLYPKFDAAVCSALDLARAVPRFAAVGAPNMIEVSLVRARAAGRANPCTSSRHHIPGAQ
jgi:hypothetical protein